jgi:MscS family membrane protein
MKAPVFNQVWQSIIRFSHTSVFAEVLIVTLLVVLLAVTSRHVLLFFGKRQQLPEWMRVTLHSFSRSLHLWIFAIGFLHLLDILVEASAWHRSHLKIELMRTIVLILGIDWVCQKIKSEFLFSIKRKMSRKGQMEGDVPLVVNKLVTLLFHLLALLVILENVGVSLSTLYTFGGIGGFALTLAAKEVIANFFGGLMISFSRPFTVGDWITSPNKSFEGVVESIGWHKTKIRTLNRRPAYIPNSIITDAIIENPGRMYNRQLLMLLHLRYEDLDKVVAIVDDLRALLHSNSEIDSKLSRLVHFVKYTDTALEIKLSAFTKDTQEEKFLACQQELLLAVGSVIHQHGAEFVVLSPSCVNI